MDWKILTVVVVALVGFFSWQKCSSSDAPDFDKKQAMARVEQAEQVANVKLKQSQEARDAVQKLARSARGARPEAKTAVLQNKYFKAVLSTKGGSLTSMTLMDPQYQEAPRNWETGLRDKNTPFVPVDMVSTNTKVFEMSSALRFDITEGEGVEAYLPDTDYQIVEQSPTRVVFRLDQPGLPLRIVKKFEVADNTSPYLLWMTVRVENTGAAPVRFRAAVSQSGYQHTTEAGGSYFTTPPNLLQGICRHDDETFTKPWNNSDLNEPFSGVGKIGFTGIHTNYFVSAMIPDGETPATCLVSKKLDSPGLYPTLDDQPWGHVVAALRYAEVSLAPGESHIYKVKNFFGPKRYEVLQSVGSHMEKSVDFGMFWPICQVLLKILFWLQKYVINWGVAIIILTVLVKTVLIPFTQAQVKSMARMKALKPEIDRINERLKNDAMAKQQATMALYKQHKINPLSGCLPVLLQMPIWIALYSTLRTSPELYRAPFFGWITDLASPDPYFVTPIIMGGMMFLQQKVTPMAGDAMQVKLMTYFMPIMFTSMMLFLPSGLTLYILVNTVLSLVQQVYVNRQSVAVQTV